MKRLELPITGMDCASCAAHVRTALEGVAGVSSVEVLVSSEKAVLEYDEGAADVRTLVEAVEGAGYGVPDLALTAASDGNRRGQAEGFARRAIGVTGLVFGAVLLVVVAGEWLGLFEAAGGVVPFPVGVLIVGLVGWPAFRGVIRAAVKGRVTSHTLMTVGVIAALVIGQWVTAAVVAFFMRVGDFVEGFTLQRGRQALRDLEALAPTTARIERPEGAAEIPIRDVRIGDVAVVRPGERIPVDGEVVSGRATVEQAAITGESMPVEAEPGSRVFAATIVHGGALRVRTSGVGDDATFGRIVRMVEHAEATPGRTQKLADRVSGWYLPIVAGIAAATFVLRGDALATAAVLVVACSCAFAIATPVAMLATIGASARRGLLMKGGRYIEALARADVVLVDKTGTFTFGRPTVTAVVSLDDTPADELIHMAASVETDSEHPFATAIRSEAKARGLGVEVPAAFSAIAAVGVSGQVAEHRITVGSERMASPSEDALRAARRLREQGHSIAYIGRDEAVVGVIGFRDTVRPEVPDAVAELRSLGFERIEILTGDHEGAARAVAESLGVGYRADLLPEDKIRIVEEYQAGGHTVVMIGDGVNDAPALARADVGIAMGDAGTDLALEVAHVAVMRDDWRLVPEAIRTARRTMRVVKGNFALTILYNVVGLSLAAFGVLPPIAAAAAQSIPDLGILGNSARLLRSSRGPLGARS